MGIKLMNGVKAREERRGDRERKWIINNLIFQIPSFINEEIAGK